jgi:amino acid transporter
MVWMDPQDNTNVFEETAHQVPVKTWQSWLIGRPLATADAPHQTIGKLIGLAIFSSDALSSVAYGPQELMVVLAAASVSYLPYAFPIAIGIVVLLAILTFSYEQTIQAYPGGGGAYIVARDNLGELPAQAAGAALLADYVLTVSVSISSGVAQIVSAFEGLYEYRVEIAVGLILFIMLINLRGVKESGRAFAIPTYIFLILTFVTVIIGLVRYLAGTLGLVVDPPAIEIGLNQPLTLLIILRAFANGTASVTGVEAISNGIPAFKEPRSRNAGITLLWMSAILAALLLGITFLSIQIGALPAESETIFSQLTRTVFGGQGFLYLATIITTTAILVMAGNTAFAGFPRLSALQAADGFLPRQLTYRGSRLVYSNGIAALAIIACLLVIIFRASVSKLIPLYAIGVFLSFTLAQAGMARRWWKAGHLAPGAEVKEAGSILRYEEHWQHKMIINGLGALTTLLVTFVFAATKFQDGAWIVVVLIPVLVGTFFFIHRHYKNLARQLSLEKHIPPGRVSRIRVIMPISGVHRGTVAALRYARSLSDDITAVHISVDEKETAKLEEKWEIWGEGVRLVVLNSPYRLFVEPLLQYIDKIDVTLRGDESITIVVPQFIPRHRWNTILHTRTAELMRRVLLQRENIVIIEVPYQVH